MLKIREHNRIYKARVKKVEEFPFQVNIAKLRNYRLSVRENPSRAEYKLGYTLASFAHYSSNIPISTSAASRQWTRDKFFPGRRTIERSNRSV